MGDVESSTSRPCSGSILWRVAGTLLGLILCLWVGWLVLRLHGESGRKRGKMMLAIQAMTWGAGEKKGRLERERQGQKGKSQGTTERRRKERRKEREDG
jgi:hypothetical protein